MKEYEILKNIPPYGFFVAWDKFESIDKKGLRAFVSLAMPVTACAYNHNPIFESDLSGRAFGCTSAKDGDADYSTTYRNLIDPTGMKWKNDH